MTFTIINNPEPARLIRMGHAPEVIQPEHKLTEPEPPPPVLEPEIQRGRKKMADEKKLDHETGVKKIREEDAGTQGAVGSGGVNAPAQEKTARQPQESEQNKEGE